MQSKSRCHNLRLNVYHQKLKMANIPTYTSINCIFLLGIRTHLGFNVKQLEDEVIRREFLQWGQLCAFRPMVVPQPTRGHDVTFKNNLFPIRFDETSIDQVNKVKQNLNVK